MVKRPVGWTSLMCRLMWILNLCWSHTFCWKHKLRLSVLNLTVTGLKRSHYPAPPFTVLVPRPVQLQKSSGLACALFSWVIFLSFFWAYTASIVFSSSDREASEGMWRWYCQACSWASEQLCGTEGSAGQAIQLMNSLPAPCIVSEVQAKFQAGC